LSNFARLDRILEKMFRIITSPLSLNDGPSGLSI
jgi:hypothetical protein